MQPLISVQAVTVVLDARLGDNSDVGQAACTFVEDVLGAAAQMPPGALGEPICQVLAYGDALRVVLKATRRPSPHIAVASLRTNAGVDALEPLAYARQQLEACLVAAQMASSPMRHLILVVSASGYPAWASAGCVWPGEQLAIVHVGERDGTNPPPAFAAAAGSEWPPAAIAVPDAGELRRLAKRVVAGIRRSPATGASLYDLLQLAATRAQVLAAAPPFAPTASPPSSSPEGPSGTRDAKSAASALRRRLQAALLGPDLHDLALAWGEASPGGAAVVEGATAEEARRLLAREAICPALQQAVIAGGDEVAAALDSQLRETPGPAPTRELAQAQVALRQRVAAEHALETALGTGDRAVLNAIAQARKVGLSLEETVPARALAEVRSRQALAERLRLASMLGRIALVAELYREPGMADTDLLTEADHTKIRYLIGWRA